MDRNHAQDLLYQALETEIGGEGVYRAALELAREEDLVKEWEEYLEQTLTHRQRLLGAFETLGLDPDAETDSRKIVRRKAEGLVEAMRMAGETLSPQGAQLVAGECVVEAETKDHLNWSLLEHIVEAGPKQYADALREPVEETLVEEAEHRFHTEGWTRELWLAHLGFDAALPPPEEEKSVQTKIGAGRAEKAREEYL
jgi:hypothetical protein